MRWPNINLSLLFWWHIGGLIKVKFSKIRNVIYKMLDNRNNYLLQQLELQIKEMFYPRQRVPSFKSQLKDWSMLVLESRIIILIVFLRRDGIYRFVQRTYTRNVGVKRKNICGLHVYRSLQFTFLFKGVVLRLGAGRKFCCTRILCVFTETPISLYYLCALNYLLPLIF